MNYSCNDIVYMTAMFHRMSVMHLTEVKMAANMAVCVRLTQAMIYHVSYQNMS